jgi:hypothetical protein
VSRREGRKLSAENCQLGHRDLIAPLQPRRGGPANLDSTAVREGKLRATLRRGSKRLVKDSEGAGKGPAARFFSESAPRAA